MGPKLILLAVSCYLMQTISAQENKFLQDTAVQPHKLNFIKTNLTSIALKNYSLQYERVLSKAVSVAVTYRTMPETFIPFKSAVLNAVGDDQDTKDIISQTKLSNYAITPEVRFYLGKGYGKGFYMATYYRYVKFTTNQVPVNYEVMAGMKKTVTLSGDLTANTGGLLLGAQWLLGKHLCLDWWIIGAHYGSGNGNFVGIPDTPLTPAEQQEVKQQLEDIDIPLTDKTVTVTANRVAVTLDGPFGGLRGGISLGFRF
jgi:hypothetical protein